MKERIMNKYAYIKDVRGKVVLRLIETNLASPSFKEHPSSVGCSLRKHWSGEIVSENSESAIAYLKRHYKINDKDLITKVFE